MSTPPRFIEALPSFHRTVTAPVESWYFPSTLLLLHPAKMPARWNSSSFITGEVAALDGEAAELPPEFSRPYIWAAGIRFDHRTQPLHEQWPAMHHLDG